MDLAAATAKLTYSGLANHEDRVLLRQTLAHLSGVEYAL